MAFSLATSSVVQWFALIVAFVILVKIVVITVNARAWLRFAKSIWKAPILTEVISIVLAAVVLYYLLQSGFSIVSIFAVMLLFVLLSAATMAVYVREFMDMAEKMLKSRSFIKKAGLPVLIWLALTIWVLKEILI